MGAEFNPSSETTVSGKPRLLDLFCGAGGCSAGYHRAGFEVVGVDVNPQPNYPFEFYQADALEFPLNGFDVIHASPPCQAYSPAAAVHRNRGKAYADLVGPTRARLENHSAKWVIENVPGSPLNVHLVLCGLMFGLKVFRHRYFELSDLVLGPPHRSHAGKTIGDGFYSVAGGSGRWKTWGTVQRNVSKGTVAEWREAMGIDWMTRRELTQAIPPAYTEWIGRQWITQLARGR